MKSNNIRNWIEDLPKRGKITFSKEEIEEQFPNLANHNIQMTLSRLAQKKKIQSVWRGFWVIVPVEYGLKGVVDPVEYIDALMKFLNKQYYVALLNAAELHGAAHQAPQEFFVITNTTKLRSKMKKDVKINFVAKKVITQNHVKILLTGNDCVNVSTAILTAYDLVCYMKKAGGVNRVATILNELAEKVNFSNVDKEFMRSFNIAVTQRLGYLFEELGFEEIANKLHRKAKIAELKFRKTPLVVVDKTKDLSKYPVSERWHLIINEQIDIDE